jgi:hypothetical protein
MSDGLRGFFKYLGTSSLSVQLHTVHADRLMSLAAWRTIRLPYWHNLTFSALNFGRHAWSARVFYFPKSTIWRAFPGGAPLIVDARQSGGSPR